MRSHADKIIAILSFMQQASNGDVLIEDETKISYHIYRHIYRSMTIFVSHPSRNNGFLSGAFMTHI